jgi:penicillin-binding protein 1A
MWASGTLRSGSARSRIKADAGLTHDARRPLTDPMPLKLVCPNCRADVRLNEPLPLPGAAIACERCATAIAVTYPAGVIDQLKARGKRFADAARRETTGPIPIGPSTGPVGRPRNTPNPATGPVAPPPQQRMSAAAPRADSRSGADSGRSASATSTPATSSMARAPLGGSRPASPNRPSVDEFSLPIDPSTETAASRAQTALSPTELAEGRDEGKDEATLADEATAGDGRVARIGRNQPRSSQPRSGQPRSMPQVERTVGGMRSPYGALPNNAAEPEAGELGAGDTSAIDEDDSLDPPETQAAPMVKSGSNRSQGGSSRTPAPTPHTAKDRRSTPGPLPGSAKPSGAGRPPASNQSGSRAPSSRTPGPVSRSQTPEPAAKPPSRAQLRGTPTPAPRTSAGKASNKRRMGAVTGAVGCLGSMGMMGVGGIALLAVLALAVAGGGYWYFSKDLPTVEALQTYTPPTVTTVMDRNGKLMGEIFEEKRYVTPIDQIPEHVKQAYIAAEDANFYNHGGVDFMGMVRAMGRNALKGRFAQGASTITQQVARNSFLSREKSITRKIKEIFLSWRIEEAYEKDHILFLYLNEIFLGAQSYGVEAAARTYFGKHVQDITIAEAAIIAGLPPAPSRYAPYKGWDSARSRQEYVLAQMKENNFITEAEYQAAMNENVKISSRENKFRSKAPWFTEHVRRYLVEKYGEEQVLHQGLTVTTTCDLDLQLIGQKAVRDGVYDTDWRMGYRRKGVKNVGKGNIAKTREEMENKLREQYAEEQDPAGRVEVPPKSVLEEGRLYDAVIVEVSPKWAKIGIGAHDAILSISNNDWLYEPNPKVSWRGREAKDLTAMVDSDDDGKKDSPILMAGDIVKVTVDKLSTTDPAVSKYFTNTPGASTPHVAVKMFQVPEVESALLSMELSTGAVRAMIGGSDFDKSEFNRTIQARRQVGSTFKPIVYAAAVESKRVTTATLVLDGPVAISADKFVWKPANYGNDFEGDMTMRTALQKSKNTCTVRILETADPGMNDDVVYKFARRLGIGGPPLHTLPADSVRTPKNDHLCPWIKEERDFKICMDRYPPKDPSVSDAQHRAKLTATDEYWCRACDMSMGLGSASLTMEEMVRAYSAFATGGKLVEPYYVEEVKDRDGKVLEQHAPAEHHQVMDPAVASIATWLLEGVVNGGTASQAGQALKLNALAGKTGTTNDEKDAWFVGFTPDVITAVWFGYDQPQTLGVSSTGGRTSLPVWIEYMKAATATSKDRPFKMAPNIAWAQIDEKTGKRVTSGGVSYPFLEGTVPEGTGHEAGQVPIEDIQ